MRVAPPRDSADPAWLALRQSSWPNASRSEHLREMTTTLQRSACVLLALDEDGTAVGFVEATKRDDFVNGTETSPVAFLEGLYVQPSHRRRGVSRMLVSAVATWARALSLSELASDSPLENVDAHAVHRALGFVETERVVYFRKQLPHAGA